MAPVFAKLADLEIEPLGPVSEFEGKADSPLVERIRRNAETLRTQWRHENISPGDVEEEDGAPF